MKSTKKAFTLVELIVVITILAILGTIAFISLGSYTGDARNAKRTDGISKIASSMESSIIGGKSVMSFAVTGGELAAASIAGANGVDPDDATAAAPANYIAGDANFTALGIKQDDFQDPTDEVPFKIGATTKKESKYEVAASPEDGADRRARVMGNWTSRTASGTTTIGTLQADTTKFKMTNTGDINKLQVGDTLAVGGVVNSISNDGLTITTSDAIASGTAQLALAADETPGLIAAVNSDGAVTTTAVVDGTPGVGNLPY